MKNRDGMYMDEAQMQDMMEAMGFTEEEMDEMYDYMGGWDSWETSEDWDEEVEGWDGDEDDEEEEEWDDDEASEDWDDEEYFDAVEGEGDELEDEEKLDQEEQEMEAKVEMLTNANGKNVAGLESFAREEEFVDEEDEGN